MLGEKLKTKSNVLTDSVTEEPVEAPCLNLAPYYTFKAKLVGTSSSSFLCFAHVSGLFPDEHGQYVDAACQ